MHRFACPRCRQPTVGVAAKHGATSLQPTRCPGCGASVYPSGRKTYLLRSLEALIVTMIVILAFIRFDWSLVVLVLAVITVMEAVILFLVPLVELQRREPRP